MRSLTAMCEALALESETRAISRQRKARNHNLGSHQRFACSDPGSVIVFYSAC